MKRLLENDAGALGAEVSAVVEEVVGGGQIYAALFAVSETTAAILVGAPDEVLKASMFQLIEGDDAVDSVAFPEFDRRADGWRRGGPGRYGMIDFERLGSDDECEGGFAAIDEFDGAVSDEDPWEIHQRQKFFCKFPLGVNPVAMRCIDPFALEGVEFADRENRLANDFERTMVGDFFADGAGEFPSPMEFTGRFDDGVAEGMGQAGLDFFGSVELREEVCVLSGVGDPEGVVAEAEGAALGADDSDVFRPDGVLTVGAESGHFNKNASGIFA